jgi:hypothetical protein
MMIRCSGRPRMYPAQSKRDVDGGYYIGWCLRKTVARGNGPEGAVLELSLQNRLSRGGL